MPFKRYYASPIGTLLLVADERALTGLWFLKEADIRPATDENPILMRASAWLDAYFGGEAPPIDFPLYPEGSAFQREVWELLRTIPYGETLSYGALAARIAARHGIARMSAQAVGNAVGRNPISIVIPCHRVIGANGRLVGYGGGLDKKEALLRLERAHFGTYK